MNYSRIIYQIENRRATIMLNRPEKRNALDDLMIKELATAFTAAGKDQDVKVIILSGAGSTFCAGADLEYLDRISKFDLEENRKDSAQLAHLFRLIYELRKPIIASVNGPALAGGCGLACVCDFVIASEEQARFGYTEVRIGFIPAIVMIFLVKRIGEGRARELVLRGNILTAQEAKEIGLVSMVVPEERLQATVDTLTQELVTQNSLTSMGLCKEMLSKLHGMNLLDALDFAANMNAASRMTTDCKQGVTAFLKKEKVQW
jgi:methylglutaconyl-CoA hydratase